MLIVLPVWSAMASVSSMWTICGLHTVMQELFAIIFTAASIGVKTP